MKNYPNNILFSINDQDPASVKLLRAVLSIVTFSILGIAILLFFIHRGRIGAGIIGAVIIASLSGVSLFLSYRNIHWFGRLFFPLSALAGLTFLAISTDGLHDSTVVALTLVIIFTSLLAGQTAIPLATVSTLLAVWVIAYADISGINQSIFAKATKDSDAIGLAVVISIIQIIAAASLSALMSRLNTVLETVRRSEMDLMENNRELNNIRASLEQTVMERTRAAEAARAEAEAQSWVAYGQARLAEEMRGDLELSDLANRVTGFVSHYIGAQGGAMFVALDGALKLMGRYAYPVREAQKTEFRLGEGLVGESARVRQILRIKDIPADAPLILSALGDSSPREILIAPLESNGQVFGVLEFITLGQFTAEHEFFLKRISESAAIALRSAQTRMQMNQLLRNM